MSSKASRLDPRVRRTRQLLTQSFMELLLEKGFQSITVQDIAERATINRATFYAHFDDKYALLDHIIIESFQEKLDGELSPDSDFSQENLKILILTVFQYLQQFNGQVCHSSDAKFEPLIEKEIQSQIFQIILRWITQLHGEQPDSLNTTEVIASAVSWTIFGVGLDWSRGDMRQGAEAIAGQLLSLITEGLYATVAQEKTQS